MMFYFIPPIWALLGFSRVAKNASGIVKNLNLSEQEYKLINDLSKEIIINLNQAKSYIEYIIKVRKNIDDFIFSIIPVMVLMFILLVGYVYNMWGMFSNNEILVIVGFSTIYLAARELVKSILQSSSKKEYNHYYRNLLILDSAISLAEINNEQTK